ncbi:camp-binding domain-like protein [Gonapodya prolifera JEL478]|uniref:Camp-binding domain-like protein n=1 Tax=Gonapodya prolifera (strain JEL478) TaxID=1344416 RepID=A0A139AJY3_GONPJ|nr:camp-binding domain-like protein [Gonapodya prolifera JEL478]|eukprot:KXS16854.1 camp-binding domain-like protein [Gonapodya prolifera JEL478]
MQRRGFLTLVSSIPWDAIPLIHQQAVTHDTGCRPLGGLDPFRLWALFRLLRFVPMSKLVTFCLSVKLSRFHTTVVRLTKCLLLIVLFSHLSGCAFWFISAMDEDTKSWINTNGLGYEDSQGLTFAYRYLRSLYAAHKATFFIFRDVYTVPERIYCVLESLVAVVLLGSLFASLTSIFRHYDRSEVQQDLAEEHKRRLIRLREYMHQKHLPPSIQKRILEHEQFRFVRAEGNDDADMFRELPRVLQVDVYTHFYLKLVQNLPLFKDLDLSFQQSIVLALRPLTVLPGWCIFREDDEAGEMYFIKDGAVEVLKDGVVFLTLGEGKFFGEIALVENTKRTVCFLVRLDELNMRTTNIFI